MSDSKKKIKVETPPSSNAKSRTEDLENESLSLLIPDVQTTSMLVHKAVDRLRWEHLKIDGSSTDGEARGQGAGEESLSTENKYSTVMMQLQFGEFYTRIGKLKMRQICDVGATKKHSLTTP